MVRIVAYRSELPASGPLELSVIVWFACPGVYQELGVFGASRRNFSFVLASTLGA